MTRPKPRQVSQAPTAEPDEGTGHDVEHPDPEAPDEGKTTPGAHTVQAPLRPRPTGAMKLADETYPEELKYHAEHDWARIDGDEATFGITWYAQDSLGEVIFCEPPEVGATITVIGDVRPAAEGEVPLALRDSAGLVTGLESGAFDHFR